MRKISSKWSLLSPMTSGPKKAKRIMDFGDKGKAANIISRLKSPSCLSIHMTKEFRYKALMNELVNDGITLSKLEINTGFFINRVTQRSASFPVQRSQNINRMKDSELASLLPILKDSSRRILKGLAVQKKLTKLNAINVARKHKPELRHTKDFEAKYNKVKAKLALLSLSASTSKATSVKNKGLIAEAYEWDEEEVSSDDNEMVKVKELMALADENDAISKEGRQYNGGKWVKYPSVKRGTQALLEMEYNDDKKLMCSLFNWLNLCYNTLINDMGFLGERLGTGSWWKQIED
ncbi:hypothetical protein Tco_0308773 [Tanacetum coccineum]